MDWINIFRGASSQRDADATPECPAVWALTCPPPLHFDLHNRSSLSLPLSPPPSASSLLVSRSVPINMFEGAAFLITQSAIFTSSFHTPQHLQQRHRNRMPQASGSGCSVIKEPRSVVRKLPARTQHEGVGAIVRRSIGG